MVKVEDTVKVGKDCCEHCDGGFWILPRELKFGGIGCLSDLISLPFLYPEYMSGSLLIPGRIPL